MLHFLLSERDRELRKNLTNNEEGKKSNKKEIQKIKWSSNQIETAGDSVQVIFCKFE